MTIRGNGENTFPNSVKTAKISGTSMEVPLSVFVERLPPAMRVSRKKFYLWRIIIVSATP